MENVFFLTPLLPFLAVAFMSFFKTSSFRLLGRVSSVFAVVEILSFFLFYKNDDLILTWAMFLVVIFTICTILMLVAYDIKFEVPQLLVICVFACYNLLFSYDLIEIYSSLELLSISSYILVASSCVKDGRVSTEGMMKYFLIGIVSACFVIYGFSILFACLGGVVDIQNATLTNPDNRMLCMIAITFVLAGLLFKMSAAPFQIYAPDVYQSLNIPVLSFIMNVPKIAGFVVIFKFFFLVSSIEESIFKYATTLLTASCVASMIVGSVGALFQKDLKRILAYSGIANVAYILTTITTQSGVSLTAVVCYFTIYCITNVGFLAVIGQIGANKLDDLKGLYKKDCSKAILLSILLFSAIGVPPLAGFFIKYQVLQVLINSESYLLACAMVVASVVCSFYYLKIIKTMFFDSYDEAVVLEGKKSIILSLLAFASVAINIGFIVF